MGYIQTLQKTKSVSTKTRKAVTTYVSDKTIEKIIKLLRCAFKQAVRWEIIARNPFDNVIPPENGVCETGYLDGGYDPVLLWTKCTGQQTPMWQ